MTRSFLLTMYAPENIGFPRLADYFVFPTPIRPHLARPLDSLDNYYKLTGELNPLDYGRGTGYSEAIS